MNLDKERNIKDEIIGVFSILLSVFIVLSLISYNKWDPSPFSYSKISPQNYGGIAGSYISDILVYSIGISSFLLPLILLLYGIKRLIKRQRQLTNLIGSILLIISSSMIVSLIYDNFNISNIYLRSSLAGSTITFILKSLFSPVGAFIVTLSLFFSSIILIIPLSLSSLLMKKKKDEPDNNHDFKIVKKSKKEISQKEIHISQPDNDESIILPEIKEGRYILPPSDILSDLPHDDQTMSKDDIYESASILQRKLSDFGVEGKIMQIHPGPVITMFEFEPAPGVKISKVVSLSDDLGRSMGGLKVRVSLIPGKTPIGIEVPNKKRGIVTLREIIDSDRFSKNNSLLTLSLGKDIYGNPIIDDLAKMPHLLVAGTTGSGKSVSVNSMIMSILYKAKPNDVKMLMIDPKLLELSIYDGIPHLISHVITNPKEAAEALKKMVLEMERRYRVIAEKGSRNIYTYNSAQPEDERLPFIVVIIDELADLMFTASKHVEDSIVRLAQMARAAGIHLIVATQRPSVDVITGIIKANFPSRIAFQVSTKVDSRTIIDSHGAEKLLGHGDMLVMNPGARILRVHGSLVTETEVKAVIDFVKAQGSPDYSIFEDLLIEETMGEDISEDRDDLYKEVIRYAESIGEVSISSIQRRFKIGYNRAARIVEMMEVDGFIGPPKGAGKPRDFVSSTG